MFKKKEKANNRYYILDGIRGVTILSMVIYHLVWDLIYLFGIKIAWFETTIGYLWQQSICWVFILLSGFCWNLGKRKGRRGLYVFGSGMLISLITILIMPQQTVLFGVLTCLGSCMLLLIPLNQILKKVNPLLGFVMNFCFFVLTRNINNGFLGFERIRFVRLPNSLYQGLFMTYLGFPDASFFSTDYFSLFPWFFLFLSGYFLYGMIVFKEQKLPDYFQVRMSFFEWIGKHSLLLYLLHQPVVYLILLFLF